MKWSGDVAGINAIPSDFRKATATPFWKKPLHMPPSAAWPPASGEAVSGGDDFQERLRAGLSAFGG
jgi:hypothetical protein